MKTRTAVIFAAMLFLSAGCTMSTKHEVEVKPMHITIDVNVRVDRALDDFFGDIDKQV
jgi:hypothetical protein